MAKTKKKAAKKKKATKKKAASTKSKPAAGHQIRIKRSRADNQHVRARKRKAKRSPESVYWTSKDIAYTVTFTGGWPFQRDADVTPRTILVPAGGDSKTFTLDDDAPTNSYGYKIDPPVGGPGEPQPTPEVGVDP